MTAWLLSSCGFTAGRILPETAEIFGLDDNDLVESP